MIDSQFLVYSWPSVCDPSMGSGKWMIFVLAGTCEVLLLFCRIATAGIFEEEPTRTSNALRLVLVSPGLSFSRVGSTAGASFKGP